jgi:hypothetical protein
MMKKSSYEILFIACFAFFFILNSINVIGQPDLPLFVAIIIGALIESLTPYLVLILIIRIINRDSNKF